MLKIVTVNIKMRSVGFHKLKFKVKKPRMMEGLRAPLNMSPPP
jgi:hypothetical protein